MKEWGGVGGRESDREKEREKDLLSNFIVIAVGLIFQFVNFFFIELRLLAWKKYICNIFTNHDIILVAVG